MLQHLRAIAVLGVLLLAACAGEAAAPAAPQPPAASPQRTALSAALPTVPPAIPAPTAAATPVPSTPPAAPSATPLESTALLTYVRPDGNRLVGGSGRLPAPDLPLDIPLDGVPLWLFGTATPTGSMWAVALQDGRVQTFTIVDGALTIVEPQFGQLPPGTPPLFVAENGQLRLVQPPADAAPLTHPVLLGASGRIAYISTAGDLVLHDGVERARLPISALPDARIVVDEQQRLLVFAGPSARYAHGVLGDALEATRIVLIETAPALRVVRAITLDGPQVFEGLAPIWADLDGDGTREIVATVSDGQAGARLVAYDEAGQQGAAGPALGRGNRWRHQIAAGPFAPDSSTELVDVRTPHLGGVVEFFALRGDTLVPVAELPGYASHVLGSRNLDMAVAADVDGDGRAELLLPSQDRSELAAIGHAEEGATVRWAAPVGAQISSNVVVARMPDGQLAAGLGRADGVLRLWLPRR